MKARKVSKLDPAGTLRDNAVRIVGTRLNELKDLSGGAIEPGASEEQHDMRIAAKRLRYVLEVTGACFGPDGDAARRTARDLQTVLGEIHDCDVMLPRVEAKLEELRVADARSVLVRAGDAEDLDPEIVRDAPNRAAYRGLDLLTVHLRARRALLFERFLALWQTEAGKGTLAALKRAL